MPDPQPCPTIKRGRRGVEKPGTGTEAPAVASASIAGDIIDAASLGREQEGHVWVSDMTLSIDLEREP